MPGKAIHVLIADDDDDDQFIIKSAISEFNSEHISVSSVYDGQQLLDFLDHKGIFSAEGKPDLILLDINMPIMNGIEALKKIKMHPRHKNIPVCMISTLRGEQQQKECRDLGALDFFSKPNHVGDYKLIIDNIFARTIYTADA